jgi:hypothetical protein
MPIVEPRGISSDTSVRLWTSAPGYWNPTRSSVRVSLNGSAPLFDTGSAPVRSLSSSARIQIIGVLKRRLCAAFAARFTDGIRRNAAAAKRPSVGSSASSDLPRPIITSTSATRPTVASSSSQMRGIAPTVACIRLALAAATLCRLNCDRNSSSRPRSFTSFAPPSPCCRCWMRSFSFDWKSVPQRTSELCVTLLKPQAARPSVLTTRTAPTGSVDTSRTKSPRMTSASATRISPC